MNRPNAFKLTLTLAASAISVVIGLGTCGMLTFLRSEAVFTPDLSQHSAIDTHNTESIADWGNSKLSSIKSTHFLTGSTASNPTNPKEIRFYKRLIFGDRTDILDEKNNCHFRIRIKNTSALTTPAKDLVLLLLSSVDKKTLRFEQVGRKITSEPYILVDAIRQPTVRGLH